MYVSRHDLGAMSSKGFYACMWLSNSAFCITACTKTSMKIKFKAVKVCTFQEKE